MKKKPDILVVLAAVLGLGIAISSVGNADNKHQVTDTRNAQVVQVNQ